MSLTPDFRELIRDIPDFPKPGIMFKDITPLLSNPQVFQAVIDALATEFASKKIDFVAAAEARGFLFGTPLALALNAGFIPIRKPGKLPYDTITQEYELEYGKDRLEMHRDALAPGRRVLLLDDVLATGGTIRACRDLVSKTGADLVACAFVVELTFLEGRKTLVPNEVFSVVSY